MNKRLLDAVRSHSRKPRPVDHPDKLAVLERVYVDGERIGDVAKDEGISKATIWRWRRDLERMYEKNALSG